MRWKSKASSITLTSLFANTTLSVDPELDDVNTRVTKLEVRKLMSSGVDCLVIIHAPTHAHLGRRYLLDRPTMTIGRGRDNDIVLPNDSVSRQHVRIERRANGLFSVDLGSTNGTYVNEAARPIHEHNLMRGDQLKIGDTIFKYLSGSDVEAQYHEIIFAMTITDGLTNLANRKQLDNLLSDEIPRAHRQGHELSLLMFDIDHFKSINDTHGHLTGDMVLRSLGTLLQKKLRQADKLGRYGGEEFCVILPGTSTANSVKMAEELRELVANHRFMTDSGEINVTISIGIACLKTGMDTEDLYKSADEMLYQAKNSGRNKVCY